jgi:hypothetical protein
LLERKLHGLYATLKAAEADRGDFAAAELGQLRQALLETGEEVTRVMMQNGQIQLEQIAFKASVERIKWVGGGGRG